MLNLFCVWLWRQSGFQPPLAYLRARPPAPPLLCPMHGGTPVSVNDSGGAPCSTRDAAAALRGTASTHRLFSSPVTTRNHASLIKKKKQKNPQRTKLFHLSLCVSLTPLSPPTGTKTTQEKKRKQGRLEKSRASEGSGKQVDAGVMGEGGGGIIIPPHAGLSTPLMLRSLPFGNGKLLILLHSGTE